MLASITPLGERGRRSTWAVTVSTFALASTVAGCGVGAGLGALGSLTAGPLDGRARLALVLAVLLAALVIDLLPAGAPGPRRQVDHRWLDAYRSWVYGAGYGAQLGAAVLTVVSSAATYAALAIALLSGEPGWGALIVGSYGAVRGLTPLLGGGVRTPERLFALHRAVARWRRRSRIASGVALVLMAATAASALV
jgi:hypothetical protein